MSPRTSPRRSGLVGDAIAHYQRLCDGGSAIVYASTIKHSREIAEQFRAAGVPAQHIDADTAKVRRVEAIASLERGETKILSNVNLFSEGLDLPALAGVIMLRPTKSLGLFLQMCGRALRTVPGKEFATIIDHAANVFEHGLCDEDHLWSLSDRKPRKKAGDAAKRCPECGAVAAVSARSCPECGFEFYAGRSEPSTVAGDLVPADPAEILRVRIGAMPLFRQREWAGADYERFKLIAELRGYRPGWAFYEHRRAIAEQQQRGIGR
jgi:DNA repair protein RadD